MPIADRPRHRLPVLGARIDVMEWSDAVTRLARLGHDRVSSYVCICNVHSVVTAFGNPDFQRVINESDMATSDGMPVAWMMRLLGATGQQRINGPDLMLGYLEIAELREQVVSFYGSTPETLDRLLERLRIRFPRLRIGAAISPPFRTLTAEEDEEFLTQINTAGTAVLFVGLGCPKQEMWMASQRGRVHAAMVGVGAAFDYHAGVVRRAPLWMQRGGLEWLFRLASEPRRLWRRYLVTNTVFLLQASLQLVRRTRR